MISLFSFQRILIMSLLLSACAGEEGSTPQSAKSADGEASQRAAQEGRYSGPVLPLFPNWQTTIISVAIPMWKR